MRELYYITHIDNLPLIFEQGIMCQERIESEKIQFISPFKRKNDVKSHLKRRCKVHPLDFQKNLLNYTNLLFQPRNPMMYRIILESGFDKVVVLQITPKVMTDPGVIITDGDSTNEVTQFYKAVEGIKVLEQNKKIINSEWWKKCDGTKRRIMAECLVPKYVKPEYITSIIVADEYRKKWIQDTYRDIKLPITHQPYIFFQPNRRILISDNIALIDGGDMFCSEMQTVTVTVNLQGVMGKGLALRTKEQFPDVYVEYEKACRSKKISTSRPYVYKREESVIDELTDIKINYKTNQDPIKWFLLFATKRHWRNNSQIDDIEAGLNWLQANLKKTGIKSLALSALGCALGGLKWSDVAPLICKYLNGLNVPVEIYLPREYQIQPEHLTKSYLLNT